MNKEALLKLADHLDQLPPEQFDYSTYMDFCGTCGCAIGHCPTLFPELNLKWELKLGFTSLQDKEGNDIDPKMRFSVFFDIEMEDYCFLFLPGHPLNPLTGRTKAKTVAEHIRKFVANDGYFQ